MRLALLLLLICALGYAADHWDELRTGHFQAEPPPRLTLYGKKSSPSFVRLTGELNEKEIPYQKRDLDRDGCAEELAEKLARIGRTTNNVTLPVAEIDGVIIDNANIGKITRKLH